jgi:hypothetical protein
MKTMDATPNAPKPRRHPLLAGTPVGTWCPEAAGKVKGYPRTAETYARQLETLRENHRTAKEAGRLTRKNVPNGWAGRKEEVVTLHRNSMCAAQRLMEDLTTLDLLGDTTEDDRRGNDALKHCAAIAFNLAYPVSIRLVALRMLLTFVRPRPARRSVVTLDNGLAWLEGLAAEAAKVREGSRKGDKPQSITVS